ncbi:hypothetical protein GOODEAATRI_007394 [Goodea atripinnis]|uniref:Uncharacterized protein n=1 Tax=Goodea atripinnis TaxID=208336 RepID=A0ABV0PC70_9TELE
MAQRFHCLVIMTIVQYGGKSEVRGGSITVRECSAAEGTGALHKIDGLIRRMETRSEDISQVVRNWTKLVTNWLLDHEVNSSPPVLQTSGCQNIKEMFKKIPLSLFWHLTKRNKFGKAGDI